VFAALACLPFALPVVDSRPTDWLLVAVLGVFQIALAYVFLLGGLKNVGAFEASLLLLLEPVLNPVWAWLVHGERPGSWSMAGGAVILLSTVVKSWLDARAPALPAG
jgi:drug/metabolite transporter (DMT)-like permease